MNSVTAQNPTAAPIRFRPTVPKFARLSAAISATTSFSLCLILSGCGSQRAAPVEVELARATLTQVLDHWKSGGAIGDFRKQSPEIIVQEALWSGGRKLQGYALVGEARAVDANWFCDVELTLAPDTGGEPVKKTVTYAVGTDPVLTVFRAMM